MTTPPTSETPRERRTRFESTALPFLDAVYAFAVRLTGEPEEAKDLVQETMLRAYRNFDGFRPGTNCKAWLFTIVYSIFVNRYRKRRREPKMVSVEELEEKFHRALPAAPPGRGSESGGPPEWTDRDVEEAFAKLPERFRAAVLLVDVDELTYEEAAQALDCPLGTVRSRLYRARKLLYVALQDAARRRGYLKDEKSE